MPLNTQIAAATVNAEAAALAALCNNGLIRVYDGAQPATGDTALAANTLGVTLTFGAVAFPASVNGLLTSNAITAGVAVASITPTWARIFRSDGTTAVMDVSCGTAASNMIIGAFTSGTSVTIAAGAFTHNVRPATAGL